MSDFILMVQFFTRIPLAKAIPFTPEKFSRTAPYLPLLGLFMGVLEAGTAFLLMKMFRAETTILLILLLNILLTGGLHWDGVADTFDGLFSGGGSERTLSVMKDSRIGTHGTLALLLLFMLKYSLLLELKPEMLLNLIAVLPVVGRGGMVSMVYRSRYARKEGLGHYYIGRVGFAQAFFAVIATAAITGVVVGSVGVFSLVAVLLCVESAKRFFHRFLDGITGDILGAVLECAQPLFLFFYLVFTLTIPILCS